MVTGSSLGGKYIEDEGYFRMYSEKLTRFDLGQRAIAISRKHNIVAHAKIADARSGTKGQTPAATTSEVRLIG